MKERERELARQLEQLEVQMELKKSEFGRLESKLGLSQAHTKSIEHELGLSRQA